MADFLTDVRALRDKARENLMSGPVTPAYGTDVHKVVDMLNTALATEIICVLRYRQHHFTAKGLNSEPVAAEFLEHSNEEQVHADQLAARIVQLGGTPVMDPRDAAGRAHTQYIAADGLTEMIKENLDRRTDRDRDLHGNDQLDRRLGPDHAPGSRGHPRQRGGARRRHAHIPAEPVIT
jgi:bacterioferritin